VEIHLSRLVVLVLLAGIAAGYDIRSRTIPNWLTTSAFLVALLLAALVGPTEAGFRLLAAALVLLLGLPLFIRGILGGGDVKMLVAVAALVGFGLLPKTLFFACVTGALVAIAEAVRRGIILPLILDVLDAGLFYLSLGRRGRRPPRTREHFTVPYAVAIGIGAIAAWFG
jgi:prepilin peptidase CpaA